jgi:hypothetical protein
VASPEKGDAILTLSGRDFPIVRSPFTDQHPFQASRLTPE